MEMSHFHFYKIWLFFPQEYWQWRANELLYGLFRFLLLSINGENGWAANQGPGSCSYPTSLSAWPPASRESTCVCGEGEAQWRKSVRNTQSSGAPKTLVWGGGLSEKARTSTPGMLVWKAEDHCHMGRVRIGSSSPTPEGHFWEGVRFRGSTVPVLGTTAARAWRDQAVPASLPLSRCCSGRRHTLVLPLPAFSLVPCGPTCCNSLAEHWATRPSILPSTT